MFLIEAALRKIFPARGPCLSCVVRAKNAAIDEGFERAFLLHAGDVAAADRCDFARKIFDLGGLREAFLSAVRDEKAELALKCARLVVCIRKHIAKGDYDSCVDGALRRAVINSHFDILSKLAKEFDFRASSPDVFSKKEVDKFVQDLCLESSPHARDAILDGLGGVCLDLPNLRAEAEKEREHYEYLRQFYENCESAENNIWLINIADRSGILLQISAGRGDMDTLRELCEGPKAVPRRILSLRAHVALGAAARANHDDVVRYIRKNFSIGANIQAHIMAVDGRADMLRALRENGELTPNDVHNGNALSYAASNGHASVLRELREGYGLAADDARRVGALCLAVEKGHVDAIRELREGYGLAADDARRVGALYLAVTCGHANVIRELREGYGLAIKDVLSMKDNALSLAARRGHLDALRELREGFKMSDKDMRALASRGLHGVSTGVAHELRNYGLETDEVRLLMKAS